MKKSPRSGKTSTHWWSDDTKPSQYLRLGYQGHIVAIANDQIEAPVEAFERLSSRRFLCEKALVFEDGFYIPHSQSQPSFDAFVYEAGPQRATIFQVTVSNQHPISTEGLDWLYNCGAKSLRLVVVTPPLKGSVLDIWVANSHKDMLGEVYHLALPNLKKCSVAELESIMPTSTAGGRVAAVEPSTQPRGTLPHKSKSKKENKKAALLQPVQSARKKGEASNTALVPAPNPSSAPMPASIPSPMQPKSNDRKGKAVMSSSKSIISAAIPPAQPSQQPSDKDQAPGKARERKRKRNERPTADTEARPASPPYVPAAKKIKTCKEKEREAMGSAALPGRRMARRWRTDGAVMGKLAG
ncbi:hypothetical protein WOLCODRAFT_167256 [Wolfiporia cocos MD-104 SS10]|uniref:Uncharacterized protein n=1 Tax=Wolfiporia cocos (strain MD-104) TaxID=742152 RepID=A0A2H3JAZ4_WOLCO|nr:hypothetical protein WOLCODRAFT_167256 [Wolfiporia cocos MD-104 SS10]